MKHDTIVTRVVQESPQVSTVFFTINGTTFPYTAGQYITVYFEDSSSKIGKAYSLSSAPSDSELSITVKDIGEFSHRICSLKVNDHISLSSPYGFFKSNDTARLVAIVAGVGISPVWSIVRDELERDNKRSVELHFTAPQEEELVFKSAIDTLFSTCIHAVAHYYVTQETSQYAMHRRFSAETDLKNIPTNARFYICGSEDFVRGIWRQLMHIGVNTQRISTETFFESSI